MDVNQIFNAGPEAVIDWFENTAAESAENELTIKQLADICWTRASTLVLKNSPDAKPWAQAALSGYEFLGVHGSEFVAESSRENAEALRKWKILSKEPQIH